jgi:hypothetical protein
MNGDNICATHLYNLPRITNPKAKINEPIKQAMVWAHAINIANQLSPSASCCPNAAKHLAMLGNLSS